MRTALPHRHPQTLNDFFDRFEEPTADESTIIYTGDPDVITHS